MIEPFLLLLGKKGYSPPEEVHTHLSVHLSIHFDWEANGKRPPDSGKKEEKVEKPEKEKGKAKDGSDQFSRSSLQGSGVH